MTRRSQIFLALLFCAILVLVLLAVFLWWLSFAGAGVYAQATLLAVVLTLLAFSLVLGSGLLGVMFMRVNGRAPVVLQPMAHLVLRHFLPLALAGSRLVGVSREDVQGSFVELNNQLVRAGMAGRLAPDQILLLAPHCLQWHQCSYRVTGDLGNCQQCGRCEIAELRTLQQRYGVSVGVTTGGSAARELIISLKPRAVVAVACERDLSSGIKDIQPLPSIGILNIRPHGPCLDTRVDIQKVEEGIRFFVRDMAENPEKMGPCGGADSGLPKTSSVMQGD